MIKAIAWDVDGTLVDSEPLHLFALREVCRAYAVDISDLDDGHFVGVHIEDVWSALKPRFPCDLIFASWSRQIEEVYEQNHGRLVAMPGAVQTIERLAAMGLRQVAVSNSNRKIVDTNLVAIGVAERMEFSISLDDVCEGKPDAFPYRMACYRLRLDPSEVLAVEDSNTGVASARAAGLQVAFFEGPNDLHDKSIRALSTVSEILEIVSAKTKPVTGGSQKSFAESS